jgi:hypothetical protein
VTSGKPGSITVWVHDTPAGARSKTGFARIWVFVGTHASGGMIAASTGGGASGLA